LRKFLIPILAVLASCSGFRNEFRPDDPVVARAYSQELHLSQAVAVVPKNIPGKDSAAMVQNFISKWVQQQILLEKAKQNLSAEEQDFTRQLEEYRNSLLLYSYEKKLISMNLDTIVTVEEIEQYYYSNKSQFELRGNIVKFDYVKIPDNSRQAREFRRMLKSSSPSDSVRLVEYCGKYATDYWLTREWVFLGELLAEVPLKPDNEEIFLRRTKYTETEDNAFLYLLRIVDYMTNDSLSPLAFERNNIRNVIINSRKLDFLETLRQKDIDEAFGKKEAEVF
jgi:hypothetical protein